jgi:hypothetical protein
VRLHTKRLKENPGLVQNRKKTPGEKLVEKFLIKDKPTEKAKRREIEADGSGQIHARTDPGAQEAEDWRPSTHRKKSVKGLERLVDGGESEGVVSKKKKAPEEEEEVVTVTQSEALDILLSEAENEAESFSAKAELTPEPPPSEKYAFVKAKQEKSNTVKKRPKKLDKGSTIKRVDHNATEIIQAPAEKSLLQRRNTVKKLRRNSRDIELLSLGINESESSMLSIPAGSLPAPVGAVTSAPPTSATSTPVNSAPSTPITSTPVTPGVDALPSKVRTPVVFESQRSNRDMYPFKTKVNDRKSEPNVSKIVSADVSVENSCDVFRKIPLRFVVDEIKVEETPKSPKLLHYEVTVEDVASTQMSFQKRGRVEESVPDKGGCNLAVEHGLESTEGAVACECSSVSALKGGNEFEFNVREEEQKAEIIPETSPDPETVPKAQVDSFSFPPGDRCNGEGENKQTLMADIPSLVRTTSKQDTESCSRPAKDELENVEIKHIDPKYDSKASPADKESNQAENLKNTTSVDNATVHKDGTRTPKAQLKEKVEKENCNKRFMEYLKKAERNCAGGRPETPSTPGQKKEQPCIPAWKKALMARTQANNASKAQRQTDAQSKCQLIPVPQASNKDGSTAASRGASEGRTLEAIVETRTETCERLPKDTKPPVGVSKKGSSVVSKAERSEDGQAGEVWSADAESLCGNSGAGKGEQRSGKWDPAGKLEAQVTEEQESDGALPADEGVEPYGEAGAENTIDAAGDLSTSKEKKSAEERKITESKVKVSQQPSARRDVSAEPTAERAKVRNGDRIPVGMRKGTEGKPAPAKGMKADQMEVITSELKPPQMSPGQKLPPDVNRTKCAPVTSQSPGTKPLVTKLKDVEAPSVSDTKAALEPPPVKTLAVEIKSGDEKKIPAGMFPVDNLKSASAEIPSVAHASAEYAKEAIEYGGIGRQLNPELKTSTSKSRLAETSSADNQESIVTKSKDEKAETKQSKTKVPEKMTPVNAKRGKSSGTGTGKPLVRPVVEEPGAGSCAATVQPKAAEDEGQAPSEDEADSEEETDSDSSDDGEEATRLSQRASTSSSEDSGFDSHPTSVPGSPAYNKKGPNTKGIRASNTNSLCSVTDCMVHRTQYCIIAYLLTQMHYVRRM